MPRHRGRLRLSKKEQDIKEISTAKSQRKDYEIYEKEEESMNIGKRAFIICLFLALAISGLFYKTASACTSIALVAEDGTVLYGRTMEWGAFDLNSRVAIIPRGYQLQSHTPEGKPGFSWKARYGVVGLDALEKAILQTE